MKKKLQLTSTGLLYLGLCLLALVMAISYQNNVTFLFTFLLISLFLLSVIKSYHNMQVLDFELDANHSPLFWAKKKNLYPIKIITRGENSKRFIKVKMTFDYCGPLADRELSHELEMFFFLPQLRQSQSHCELPLDFPCRGQYELTAMEMGSEFPFGLVNIFLRKKYAGLTTKSTAPNAANFQPWFFTVAPALIKRHELHESRDFAWPQDVAEQRAQEQLAASTQQEDFLQHRSWSVGDTLRDVDWKVYARTHQMKAKEYSLEQGNLLTLDFEQIRGSFEEHLQNMSYWCQEMIRLGHSLYVKAPEGRVLLYERSLNTQHGGVNSQRFFTELAMMKKQQTERS